MGQVFKNGSSKICGRQPLKNLKFLKFFKGCVSQILLGPLLNTLSQMRIIFSLFTNELSSRLSACLWDKIKVPDLPYQLQLMAAHCHPLQFWGSIPLPLPLSCNTQGPPRIFSWQCPTYRPLEYFTMCRKFECPFHKHPFTLYVHPPLFSESHTFNNILLVI